MDAATLRLILIVVGAVFLVGLYFWERHRVRMAREDAHWAAPPAARKREPNPGFGQRAGASGATSTASSSAVAETWPAPEARDPEVDAVPESAEPRSRAEDAYDDLAYDEDDDYDVPGEMPEEVIADTSEHEPRPAAANADRDGGADEDDPGLLIQLYVVGLDAPFAGDRILAIADEHGLIPGDMDIFHRHANDDTDQPPLFSMATLHHPGTFPFDDMSGFATRGLTLFAQFDGDTSDLMVFDEMLDAARSLADALDGEVQERGRVPLTAERARELRGRVFALLQHDGNGAAHR
jgi:cell division protein ZipA